MSPAAAQTSEEILRHPTTTTENAAQPYQLLEMVRGESPSFEASSG